ncbi:MAG: hypothetical protein GKR90_15410 [Pseudomonadales bacterium]|nr:hypothetical protein [Pseudomonadales bacterium]
MSLEIELPDFEDKIEKHKGLKRYVQLLADAWFRTPKRVAGTVCLVSACLVLINWNLQRLRVFDEIVALEVGEFELNDRLSDLELQLSNYNAEQLSADLESENSKVFQGFPDLAAWTESLGNIAKKRDIILTYTVQKPHLSAVPGVLEVPIDLVFKAEKESADKLFMGSMQLVGVLLQDHWHIDVISTQGKGNGMHLETVTIRAQVWVRDMFGFVDVQALKR